MDRNYKEDTMALRDLIVRNRQNDAVDRLEWNHPFESFQNEVDRVFNGFFNDFGGFRSDFLNFNKGSSFSPNIDVSEDKTGINIAAELPGMDEKDIEVSLKDGRLIIKGEKSRDEKRKDKEYFHVERSYGSFQRSIQIPDSVEVDGIEASFKNGLLKVKLPKSDKEPVKGRRIEVKSV
jgi:HSP20 family protein